MSIDMIFNSERLKSARLMKGFSLQELADNIDKKITKQAINKYEKSEVIPDNEMIELLSNALSVKPNFFYRTPKINLGELKFRKLQDLSVKENNIITEKTKDLLERYTEIEEIVGIAIPFINPIKDKIIKNETDVEDAVEMIRATWNIGYDAIGNVVELLEDHHIKIVELEAGDKFDGCQTMVNETIPVIVLNNSKLKSLDRKRFTALHELGHLLLNIDSEIIDKQKERLCNRFAGAMLLHKTAAIKEVGEKRSKLSMPELGALKQQYGISIQAIAYRLKDLNIITASYFKQFMFFLSMTNQRVEEPYSYQGRETSSRFTQLLFRAIAENQISYQEASEISSFSVSELRAKFLN